MMHATDTETICFIFFGDDLFQGLQFLDDALGATANADSTVTDTDS